MRFLVLDLLQFHEFFYIASTPHSDFLCGYSDLPGDREYLWPREQADKAYNHQGTERHGSKGSAGTDFTLPVGITSPFMMQKTYLIQISSKKPLSHSVHA